MFNTIDVELINNDFPIIYREGYLFIKDVKFKDMCLKCKSKNNICQMVQLRSSDERIGMVFECFDCNDKWKTIL